MSETFPVAGTDWREPILSWDYRQVPTPLWVAIAICVIVLGVAYGPNMIELNRAWSSDPNYSHGYLVVPIAILILRRRILEFAPAGPDTARIPPWWGFVGLAGVLAVRVVAYERSLQWVETATIVPAIACLVWSLGGWPLFRRAWPAVAFLVFMLPLPPSFNNLIALPLQSLATTGSCFMLQLTGQWAIQMGNTILLETPRGQVPLDVALACNGLRMLMTLATTVTAAILLIPMPIWKQLIVLVSALPIAMASNIVRIVATGWSYRYIESHAGTEWAHDISGWMMMPLALLLVGLELALLSWLAAESDKEERTVLPVFARPSPGRPGS